MPRKGKAVRAKPAAAKPAAAKPAAAKPAPASIRPLPALLAPRLWLGNLNEEAICIQWVVAHGITHIVHCGEDETKPRGRPLVRESQEIVVSMRPRTRTLHVDEMEDVTEFVEEAHAEWAKLYHQATPVFLLAGPAVCTLMVAGFMLGHCVPWKVECTRAEAEGRLAGFHGTDTRVLKAKVVVTPRPGPAFADATKKAVRV